MSDVHVEMMSDLLVNLTDRKTEIVRFTERAMQAVAGFSPLRLETLRRFAERLVGRAK